MIMNDSRLLFFAGMLVLDQGRDFIHTISFVKVHETFFSIIKNKWKTTVKINSLVRLMTKTKKKYIHKLNFSCNIITWLLFSNFK